MKQRLSKLLFVEWKAQWKHYASNQAGAQRSAFKIHDANNQTSFKTAGVAAYPWLWITLGRQYLITKVAILSGAEPLMNLEVRIGWKYKPQISKNEPYTMNTRCGIYYGPTLVSQQWVEIDCGLPRGIKGNHISFQLTDRSTGNNPLEITELEIYGWGRVCSTNDPKN